MSRFARKERPPPGFEILEPTLNALENELREKVNEQHEGKRKNEALWPVFQITWQRSRYVYDMHYVYKAIKKDVLDYCIRNKLVDGPLMAKWKKPGYERLCSTYVINSKNYKFGTVSICRVPKQYLSAGTVVEDVNTGCRGCATGAGGNKNIFGNKYGQYLAAIQASSTSFLQKKEARKAREQLFDVDEEEEEEEEEEGVGGRRGTEKRGGSGKGGGSGGGGGGGGAESDSEDEDKGAGVWADNEAEAMLGPGDEAKSSAEAEREARQSMAKMGSSSSMEGGGKRART
ncbi:unnamed protein product [Pylaiella littoralis]